MENPFAIINGMIKGNQVYLRPVRFDNEDYNKDYKKPDGKLIRPIMAVTTCPICSGLINQFIKPDADLSKQIIVNCDKCSPYVDDTIKIKPPFSFRNPIKSGVISLWDVNPTAMSNIGIGFFEDDGVEVTKKIDVDPNDPNGIVEIRSDGLGQFLRKKDMWSKTDATKKDEERTSDFFDALGDMVDDTFTKQQDVST